jgi:hypothetical protein
MTKNDNIYEEHSFYFVKSFEKDKLTSFYNKIFIECVKEPYKFKDLKKNYSAEGGFILPWYQLKLQMIYYYEKNNLKNLIDLLDYHVSQRDFRLIENDNRIIGLRTKDSLMCWTIDEVQKLTSLINQVIEFI